ncbi:MAG: hypothetical protein NZZ41_01005 [Candidatus Dojkabacteria bacterium]|nr:hypothetical protein [Candidatus Dojkabacteria bacterium]
MEAANNKTTPETENNPTLNVQDLYNLLLILDYGSNNGLYRGWETTMAVYNLRQKLYDFLKHVDPNFEDKLKNQNQQNQNNTDNTTSAVENTGTSSQTKAKKKK